MGVTNFIFVAILFSFPTITLAPLEAKLLELGISRPFLDSLNLSLKCLNQNFTICRKCKLDHIDNAKKVYIGLSYFVHILDKANHLLLNTNICYFINMRSICLRFMNLLNSLTTHNLSNINHHISFCTCSSIFEIFNVRMAHVFNYLQQTTQRTIWYFLFHHTKILPSMFHQQQPIVHQSVLEYGWFICLFKFNNNSKSAWSDIVDFLHRTLGFIFWLGL